MHLSRSIPTAALAILVGSACPAADAPDAAPADSTAPGLETSLRGTLDRIGDDSLLQSVRITALFPEPDGEAIPVLFADTGRNVTAGLAILDARATTPQLLWPDSVTQVWWSGDHALTFTTAMGRGAYVIVNVHEASIDSLGIESQAPAPTPDSAASVSLGRAQRYIDSIRVQPTGEAGQGALQYTVTHWIADPSRGHAAFHATARDSTGQRVNPAWYITNLETGAVTLVEQVVGSADELPATAGGWTRDRRFLFAKGASVYEAKLRSGS